MRSDIRFFLNGQPRTISDQHAFLTLSTWLRQVDLAIGTKVVCEEGDCGACTVLIGRPVDGEVKYQPVNSCIQLVAQMDGAHVITVEGVGRERELSVIQEKMVEHHGAQCGYCTPGFVVAMTALAEEKREWKPCDVREALTGNLCRCTGYQPIIEAAMAASGQAGPTMAEQYPSAAILPHLSEARSSGTVVEGGERRYFAPPTFDEALRIKAAHPDLVILQGGTDLGVLANKRAFAPATFMSLAHIEELARIERNGDELSIGASATLTQLEVASRGVLPELNEILNLFGSPQIRNAGTVVGNIANGSPIADTIPFFFIAGAKLELASVRGSRTVDINNFYKGYKTLDLQKDELIRRVIVTLPTADETIRLYKVSRRRDLDISAFTAAFRMKIGDGRISSVRVAFGGVAATVVRMPRTEAALEGRELSEATFVAAGQEARAEVSPISDVRGSADFRSQLAENILMKLYWELRATRPVAALA